MASALDAEVSRLPHITQLILELYCDNVSEKDIALQLGMNYNTVRQTIRHTKDLLVNRVRERLGNGGQYAIGA